VIDLTKIRTRRFTVSVAADIADRLDEYISSVGSLNRSEIVEQALRLWETLAEYSDKDRVLREAICLYQKENQREFYKSYYAGLGDSARAEDKGWLELSNQSAAQNWPQRKSPRGRT
jgi:hypothetical protein